MNLTVDVTVTMDLWDVPLDDEGRPDEDAMRQQVSNNLAGGGIDVRAWEMGDWSVSP